MRVMAPYLDEEPIQPVEDALDAPLKAKPQLVAPEPGMFISRGTNAMLTDS